MKLLFISDTEDVLSILSLNGKQYQYLGIQVDFFLLSDNTRLDALREIVSQTRFHLVLSVIKGIYNSSFVENHKLVNSVNHYISEIDIQNSSLFDDNYKQKHFPSLVNKTTSYFNVFLDIVKGVSYTSENTEIDSDLKRLDIISPSNYYLAYLFDYYRCAYYTINYNDTYPLTSIQTLLNNID